MKTIGIIPARFKSTRLPGKPLIKIDGIPMIVRVYQQALKCEKLDEIIVATDDQRIYECISNINGKVIMTSSEHPSGTDRLGEVSKKSDGDIYINIQGDEPFMDPVIIDSLVSAMIENNWELGSLFYKISDSEELFNPNAIKVIMDKNNMAIYFSRQTLPYLRNYPKEDWLTHNTFYKHIGIYAYRKDILAKIINLPQTNLEKLESLEQLRWLENGYKIGMVHSTVQTIGIDTKEDLVRAEKYLDKFKKDNQ